jgi:hypothetical protein
VVVGSGLASGRDRAAGPSGGGCCGDACGCR